MLRSTVVEPRTLGAANATFGGDDQARPVSVPAGKCASDEALVVADVGVIVTVRVGGVDQSCARVERGVDYRDGSSLVPILGGRQPHAAESDHQDKKREGGG